MLSQSLSQALGEYLFDMLIGVYLFFIPRNACFPRGSFHSQSSQGGPPPASKEACPSSDSSEHRDLRVERSQMSV